MALTVATQLDKAALDGVTAVFNSGFFVLRSSAPATLATLGFPNPAFAAASNAHPSVALSGSIVQDDDPTPGTIASFRFETSAAALRLSGSVSTVAAGTGDLRFTDVVIPADALDVSCPGGLTMTLSLG